MKEVTTIKADHMEVNHGDAHFSMFDAVQALYNPVMETYIIDAIAMKIAVKFSYRRTDCSVCWLWPIE